MRHYSTTATNYRVQITAPRDKPRSRLQENTHRKQVLLLSYHYFDSAMLKQKTHHRGVLCTWGRYGAPPYIHVVLRDGTVSSKSAATWVSHPTQTTRAYAHAHPSVNQPIERIIHSSLVGSLALDRTFTLQKPARPERQARRLKAAEVASTQSYEGVARSPTQWDGKMRS